MTTYDSENSSSEEEVQTNLNKSVTFSERKKPQKSFLKQEIFSYREQLFKYQEQNLTLSVQNQEYKNVTENTIKERDELKVQNSILEKRVELERERNSYIKKENIICKVIIGSYFLLKCVEKIKKIVS